MLSIQSAAKATSSECIVKRAGQASLHAYNCKKNGKIFQVQSCDTGWVCNAKKKNVATKDGACDDSTSAPKFIDAYFTKSNNDIAQYLKTNSSILYLQTEAGSKELDVVQKIKSANLEQKLAYIELPTGDSDLTNTFKDSKAIAKVANDRKIEFIYTSIGSSSSNLAVYKVSANKLEKTIASEAIPNCGDK